MKHHQTIYFLYCFLLVIILSCSKNNECKNGDNNEETKLFTFSDFYSTSNLIDSLNIIFTLKSDTRQEINLIITNQTDYQNNIRCYSNLPSVDFDSLPSIDFSIYEILAGRFPTPYPGHVEKLSLIYNCVEKKYYYNVDIKAGFGSSTFSFVDYFAIIVKPENDYPINFNITSKF
jgi:hypothetical protein